MSNYLKAEKYLGNTYADLTVLRACEIEYESGTRTGFVALCVCGKETQVLPYQLGKGKKSCGCRKLNPPIVKQSLDLTGRVFSELTVIALHPESRKTKTRITRQWLCGCSCGKEVLVASANLKNGDTKSCGHLKLVGYNKKPGEFRRKVYAAWKNAKYRCYDDNYLSTDNYKGRGIVVSDEFLNDFEVFYSYIGDPPTKDHTLERIDVNGNYERGNLTWALPAIQARNKIKSKRNTSGVTGVCFREGRTGIISAVAFWREFCHEKNKTVVKNKSFSFNVYGEEKAFALAVQYRKDQIKRLNELGYGYSDNHGE